MTEAKDRTQQGARNWRHLPLAQGEEWLGSVLREIGACDPVTSRGKRNIRRVKKRTSNYGARQRGDSINQSCNPKPRNLTN